METEGWTDGKTNRLKEEKIESQMNRQMKGIMGR
jgi:hypothetical protein